MCRAGKPTRCSWCAYNTISQPKRYRWSPRKQLPAQNAALERPEEELRLPTALPNRFGLQTVSLPLPTLGFQGKAELFSCRDIVGGRVRWCPRALLLSRYLLRCAAASPVASGAHQPLGWHVHLCDAPKGAGKGGAARGGLGDHRLGVWVQQSLGMPWDRGEPPTLLIRYGAGGELARCTPPRSHLGCFEHPSKSLETRRGRWGLPTAPWPGAAEVHLLARTTLCRHMGTGGACQPQP